MGKRVRHTAILLLVLLLGSAGPSWANPGRILGGSARMIGSVFQIPKAILTHSAQQPFPLGVLTGTVDGSFRTIGGLLTGALETASGAAPYAKYMVFFI